MPPFTVHWSPVSSDPANGSQLFALWPAPVNPDVCFSKAGFTDFADADELWERNADELLTRLLSELEKFGAPILVSEPLSKSPSWYRRPFAKPEKLDLRKQIGLPILWDQLPDCLIKFGESGVSLRTGNGHHLFWIEMPENEAASFQQIVARVAGRHPVVLSHLKWEHLR